MRALRFDRFGDPQVLHVADIADPVADSGEAVIAVKAASVNPSDVMNVAGRSRGRCRHGSPAATSPASWSTVRPNGSVSRCGEPAATSGSPWTDPTPS